MPPVNFAGLQNSIVFLIGKKGVGKTNAVKIETKPLVSCYFIDIRNEYRHVRKCNDLTLFTRDLMAYQHDRVPLERVSKVSFTFSNRSDYVELFKMMKGFGNTNIVFDESDTLFQDSKLEPHMIDVMLGARNNNVNLWYNSKRPFLIPITVRSQADVYMIFRTKEKFDTRYLENMTPQGFPKDPRKLPQGTCLVILDGQEDDIEIRRYPKFEGKEYKENV